MSAITVGQRVALVEEYEGLPAGTQGTVVRFNPTFSDFPFFVHFDQPFPAQFTEAEKEAIRYLGADPADFEYGASVAPDQVVPV